MGDTYRIDGTCLDVPELWVDATVTNVAIDGTVSLEEDVSDPRTWTTDIDTFEQWQTRNRVAARTNLSDPDHHIWTDLSEVYEGRTHGPHDDASESLKTYCQDILTTLLYEHQQ